MNENKEKREFAQQLEQIAETLTQAVKDGVIAVGGKGGQVIEGLANFFAEEKTAPLATEAMKLATLKKLSRLLGNE